MSESVNEKTAIFASDFDGTMFFWDRDPHVSPAVKETADAFRENGGLFGYCSGRPAGGIETFAPGVPKGDFIIGSSGARIVDGDHNVIFERHLSLATVDAIVTEGQKKGYSPSVHAGEQFVRFDDNPQFHGFGRYAEEVSELAGELIHDVSFRTDSPEEAIESAAYINRVYGEEAVAYPNVESVDIVPKGCSKGNGLKIISEYFGITRTFGIGDSINDIPLLTAAETSFTFKTSPEEVQKEADRLVDYLEEALKYAAEEICR